MSYRQMSTHNSLSKHDVSMQVCVIAKKLECGILKTDINM